MDIKKHIPSPLKTLFGRTLNPGAKNRLSTPSKKTRVNLEDISPAEDYVESNIVVIPYRTVNNIPSYTGDQKILARVVKKDLANGKLQLQHFDPRKGMLPYPITHKNQILRRAFPEECRANRVFDGDELKKIAPDLFPTNE